MSAYTDFLAKIRDARKSRDQANDALYGAKMRHLALLRSRKQAGYVSADAGNDKAIDDLRNEIAEIQKRLAEIARRLRALATLQGHIADLTRLRQQLAAEAGKIEQQLADIEQQIQGLPQDDDRRRRLEAERQALRDKLSALQQKQTALDDELAALKEKERAAGQQKQALEQQRAELEATLKSKQAELDRRIKRGTSGGGGTGQPADDVLAASRAEVQKQAGGAKTKNDALSVLIGELFAGVTPQRLIEQWDDSVPIALFPLRLETKFKLEDRQHELWVRVFPDDIAVVTHEKTLTDAEVEYGTAYWKALWDADENEDKKKTAWRIVADKFGSNRSAWVALQTKPLNWDDNSITSADQLQFPVFDLTKPSNWTAAPHTRILPDRFVLLGYRGGKLTKTLVGQPVSDIVALGPAPIEDADRPSLTRSAADNRIQYGEDFRWVADFDQAVKAGLGFRVNFENLADARAGFDQLLVVGFKASADENDGQVLVEDLLNNHHYSRKGLALVQQGTPTNNTDERDAGYNSRDPLQSVGYFTETGDPSFKPTDNVNEATDGQRLAEYLGIEYAPLQYIANAGERDHSEAVAMNKALYAGTLGYYLNSMLNEVMGERTIGQVRHHFTNYVTGRGPIAAIRVGNQPYGILPTSPFARWTYPKRPRPLDLAPDDFHPPLYKVLAYLENQWKSIVPSLPHIGKSGNTGANLMAVLGLQPTSVEYFQRIGYSLDYLKNLESFADGSKYFGEIFKSAWDAFFTKLALKQFGYTTTRDDGTLKPTPLLLQIIFQHFHTRIDASNLVDRQPLSEEATIKPYDEARGLNYIHWLLSNVDSKKLEGEDFGGALKPTSLLYMLLRYSLLHETSVSIFKFLSKLDVQAPELIRSRKFANITTGPTISHWEIFQAPVRQVIASEASDMPLYAYLHSPRFSSPADLDVVQNLNEHKWALGILKDMPTARLERTLAEHVDTLSYRLDAWQTSLFDLRLREQRRLEGKTDDRRKGIYIGAQGYLENVKPSFGKRTKVSEEQLPAPLRENKDNLYVAANNGGYVHAPTLNHATAAAILRNGYITHATSEDREMLAVNLSSERVRRAHYVLEGVRNGQTLETLLGYQFERGLHDWTTRPVAPVILNDLVPVFRTAFPIKKTKVPQAGKVTGPEETIDDFHVVNGLALAQVKTDFPYGITFPPLTTDKIEAIKKEKTNIENTLDAVRDLLISECAYQLALGNFDRASAVMQSISSGSIPTDIEVIGSARGTSLAFSHRVAIHFDPALNTNPWPAVGLTTRARTEAGLNHWVGTILGQPDKIRCRATAVNAAGNALKRPDTTDLAGTVSLEDMGIQALDFLYLIRSKLEETGNSELESRVRQVFARREALADAVIVKIAFSDSGVSGDLSVRSFAEVLPLANYLRELVSGSRPLGSKDFEIQSKQVTAPADNPDNFNVTELRTRVQSIIDDFALLVAPLDSAVADAETLRTDAVVGALRSRLRMLADAGFAFALPQSAVGFSDAEIEILTTQGKSVASRFLAAAEKCDALVVKAGDAGTKPPEQISLLTQAARLMLGDDFVLLPRFNFNGAPDVAQAFAAKDLLLDHAKTALQMPLPADEWLHGVAAVRPRMRIFEMARILNDAFNEIAIEIAPIQLPYRAGDSWLGVEFPTGYGIDHDTLSIVIHAPQGFNPAAAQTGLLVDQWVEAIPNKEEVTGITFNFNNPNSVPPQVVLLAVTPEMTGHWTWDHVVDGVLDTYARAKQRAVEPDQVDEKGLVTALLPALISEFSTSRTNVSLDYALNIAFVAEKVATLAMAREE